MASTFEIGRVSGVKALGELERLRGEYPRTGKYPVLFGDLEDYEAIRENMEFAAADVPPSFISRQAIDPREWFARRISLDPDMFAAVEGDWPDEPVEQMGIITHLDVLTGKPKKEVIIGLLEISHPWESFATLSWGGWNECPGPEEHCAIHRYWATQYASDVVSVTRDVVQCTVARPPRDPEASLALARQQYIYCNDIVDQGTNTIAALAASLLNSPNWYFWWD